MADSDTSLGEAFVASTVFVTLGAAIVAFVALGWQPAVLVLALGWMVVLPLSAILTDALGPIGRRGGRERAADPQEATDADAALDALRERYARGDIDEAEFERRVERLLETEDEELAREVALGDRDRERNREL